MHWNYRILSPVKLFNWISRNKLQIRSFSLVSNWKILQVIKLLVTIIIWVSRNNRQGNGYKHRMKVQIPLIIMHLLVRVSLVSRRVLLVGRKILTMRSKTLLTLRITQVHQERMNILIGIFWKINLQAWIRVNLKFQEDQL